MQSPHAHTHSHTLLVIDDEPDIVDIARLCFESKGWRVLGANNITVARTILTESKVDAVLSDVMMRGGSGLELLAWVRRERDPSIAFYLLTGCADDRVNSAAGGGASGVFHKPCDWAALVQSVTDGLVQAPG